MYTGLGEEIVTSQLITDPNYAPPDTTAEDYAAAVMSGMVGGSDSGKPAGASANTLSAWVQQNKTAVYAGAGILVFMSLFKRGR